MPTRSALPTAEKPRTPDLDPTTSDVRSAKGASEDRHDLTALLPDRYEDIDPIAAGASGEVRRVKDRLLHRVLAMKLLRPEHVTSTSIRSRFLAEAEVTAGLQHPGIIAVHDRGELADGRLWFAMQEVHGRTLGAVIQEIHTHKTPRGFEPTPSGWTFRRAIDALARVAQTVGYAHRMGVVHRDLKPENLMVGDLGEVLVMDWGLARRLRQPAQAASPAEALPPPQTASLKKTTGDHPQTDDLGEGGASLTARSARSAAALHLGAAAASEETLPLEEDQRTREGDILGTPAYMSPEQALGLQALHGPASDVYSLGAILYHLLSGAHPYTGMGADFFHRVQAASPVPLAEALRQGPPIPVELVRICERAMKRGIPDRYPDASAMAEDLVAFLDGATRREQALSIAERAACEAPLIVALREQSASLEAEARRLLAGVRPFDPPEQKAPAWDLQDEAAKLGREAALREVEWLEGMHGALSVDPELPAAHDALSGYYKDRLIEAERTGRSGDAILFEALLRSHDRGRYAALLRGEGALTLVTDPPGASVALHRYVEEGRRLIPRLVGEIGPTPILERPIQTGSYLCVIRAAGRAEVRYPVLIERGGHWDGVPPGGRAPEPIPLPREEEVAPFEVYVPAGWCWTGGDPMAIDSLPGRRLWIEAFMMQRYPITNLGYIQFLNDLVDAGRLSDAEAACPRVQRAVAGTEDNRPAFAKDDAGHFALPSGNDWLPDLPVVLVDGRAVSAFARWLAERTGLPYRLAGELEREKAARGVDGRQYPWGDHAESTFACVAEGQEGEAAREPVTGHPKDESVYGARGLAGNVRDWCADAWTHEGPPVDKERWLVDAAPDEHAEFRVVKGGNWAAPIAHCRAASRFGARPGLYRLTVGARVVRSYSPQLGRPTNR